jgi:hypothetical protein
MPTYRIHKRDQHMIDMARNRIEPLSTDLKGNTDKAITNKMSSNKYLGHSSEEVWAG